MKKLLEFTIREKSLNERASMISSAEERKTTEIAKNLININISLEEISLATGLDIEKIKSIKEINF